MTVEDRRAANKDIVSRWVDQVFNRHNLNAVDELKVRDYKDWTPWPGQEPSLEGFKQTMLMYLQAFPDFRYNIEDMTAQGDMVVCRGTWSGTQTGPFMGMAPTGRPVFGRRIDMFRCMGDKMSEHWGTGDELSTMQMMGAYSYNEQDQNKVVVRNLVERVYNQRDLGAIDDLVDDEAQSRVFKQALGMSTILTAFPDFRVNIESMIAEGNLVTLLATVTGTHQGTLGELRPTGRQVTFIRIDQYRVENNKIVEAYQSWDNFGLMAQIGAVGGPPQGGPPWPYGEQPPRPTQDPQGGGPQWLSPGGQPSQGGQQNQSGGQWPQQEGQQNQSGGQSQGGGRPRY